MNKFANSKISQHAWHNSKLKNVGWFDSTVLTTAVYFGTTDISRKTIEEAIEQPHNHLQILTTKRLTFAIVVQR